MVYLDTSVIVAALTREVRTNSVQTWLSEQQPQSLAVSDWVTAEVSSALSIKLRTGTIGLDERAEALAAYRRFCRETFAMLPILGEHFRTAARFADEHALGLRAADALHLAIAADHGAAVWTLDAGLAAAGPALGVDAHLL